MYVYLKDSIKILKQYLNESENDTELNIVNLFTKLIRKGQKV